MTIEKKYSGAKAWSQKIVKVKKAYMKVDCSQCDAKKMYYISRQTRGADEGETVYLECKKCGFSTIN